MTITEIVRERMNEALKNKQFEDKLVYSYILNGLLSKAKDLKRNLKQDEEYDVITKLIKQTKESIDTCPTDRHLTIERLSRELEIVGEFQPKQMTLEEVINVVKNAINQVGNGEKVTMKQKGEVLKIVMPITKGRADGKLVNDIVMDYLII